MWAVQEKTKIKMTTSLQHSRGEGYTICFSFEEIRLSGRRKKILSHKNQLLQLKHGQQNQSLILKK